MEDAINSCNQNKQCIADLKANLLYTKVPMPAEYNTTYHKYPDTRLQGLNDIGQFFKRHLEIALNDPDKYQQRLQNDYYDFMMVEDYLDVMNNPNISPEIKSVVKKLSDDIDVMAYDTERNFEALIKDSLDPVKGDKTYQDFSTYRASKITHFDSALICATGKYKDINNICK